MTQIISLTSWIPNRGNFRRFYIKALDGTDLGYINIRYTEEGYGDGYYAAHRASKGDFGETKESMDFCCDPVLGRGIWLAAVALVGEGMSYSNTLALCCWNVEPFKLCGKKATPAQRKAQRNLTLTIGEE